MTAKEKLEFSLARNASEDAGKQMLLLRNVASENKASLDNAVAKFNAAGYKLKLIARKHRQDRDAQKALQKWESYRNALQGAGLDFLD